MLRTLEEYSKASSLHGVAYVFERDQPALSRWVWLLMLAVSFGLATLLSVQGVNNY